VCRDPAGRDYKSKLTLQRGDSIAPLAFPGIEFQVSDLLG
jgi:hypothetical protein